MNKKYTTINYDKLWSPSGDVFADAGGYALKYLSEKFPEKDILELIMYTASIYINKWNDKVHAFFHNSEITQPAFKGREIKEVEKFYLALLDEQLPFIEDYCRVLGIKTKLFAVGRGTCVLSGSGTFANFHHYWEEGMMLSKEAIIRMFFIPFACEKLDKKMCVINSSYPEIIQFYVNECCERNLKAIGQNISEGVLSNNSNNPSTAIFRFLDDLFLHIDDSVSSAITLYHFSNSGKNPGLDVYLLPFEAFDFYRETQRTIYKSDWQRFVYFYYLKPDNVEKINFDYNNQNCKVLEYKSHEERVVEESEIKYWKNTVYENIIHGKSILRFILKWSIKNTLNINLVNCYAFNILKMKKQAIDKIMFLADFVIENMPDMKKVLVSLNCIKNAFLLRKFILKVVEKNYQLGNVNPIVTVQDYTETLFPDNGNWKEVRDLLLIAIYQKLHERSLILEGIDLDSSFDDDVDED